MNIRTKPRHALLVVAAALAQWAMVQSAMACDMHGEFGFHRLNPFLAMRNEGPQTPFPGPGDVMINADEDAPDSVLRAISDDKSPELINNDAGDTNADADLQSEANSQTRYPAENNSGRP